MAHQVVEVVLRCNNAVDSESKHLGNNQFFGKHYLPKLCTIVHTAHMQYSLNIHNLIGVGFCQENSFVLLLYYFDELV